MMRAAVALLLFAVASGSSLAGNCTSGDGLFEAAGCAGRLHAQSVRHAPRFTAAAEEAVAAAASVSTLRTPSHLPAVAFLASAAVPGSGQLLLGDQRWVPYLALELWAWRTYLDHRARGRELEERYRDVAWSVARRVGTGARRDTVFEYYEALTKWTASGAWNRQPTSPVIVPETDPRTFNGHIWLMARALFMRGSVEVPGSPEYARALEYYRTHAVPPGYAWAWGENELEQQAFAGLITESDAAFRAGGRILGVLLANHVVSAVDALITARLNAAGGPPIRLRLGLEPEAGSPAAGVGRWSVGLSLPH
jgi:hypothetical protein